ncbi:hypothetical protein IAD21_06265 [Abditibacteriota bacterium]|nr:hypothetical protein IAD21_06265 [Abditibacteriota bacterium]
MNGDNAPATSRNWWLLSLQRILNEDDLDKNILSGIFFSSTIRSSPYSFHGIRQEWEWSWKEELN